MNLYYIYAFPSLASAILCLALGFFVYHKKKNKQKYSYFLLMSFSVFIWLFFRSLVPLMPNIFLVDFVLRLSYLGIIFIPISFLNFYIVFLEKKNKFDKYLIFFSYIMGMFFVLGLFGTNLFLNGFHEYYWGVALSAGFFHFSFVAFSSFLMFRIIYSLYVNVRKKSEFSAYRRYQMRYISWSLLFLIMTASDFFINQGFLFPP